MTFRKEKNLIYLTVENQQYVYNIATNQLVNTRSPKRALVTVKRFACYHTFPNSLLASTINLLAERNYNWLENNFNYQTLCLAEKIENICSSHNITLKIEGCLGEQSLHCFHSIQNNTTLFNYFISQITKYANQSIDWSDTRAKIIKDYQYTQYEKLYADIDLSMFSETEQRNIKDSFIYAYKNYSVFQHEQKDEYFSVYKYYYSKFVILTLLAQKENIDCCINIKDMILQYLDYCRRMNKTPQKTTNLLREYCETLNSYRLHKEQYDLEQWQKNYQSHKTALEFCYGDYMVVVPQKPQDLVKEGQEMHHCVGGYVKRVLSQQCYIVFVRHKNSPNECYITAEIMPNGSLGQYYLAYDRKISSQEDLAFRSAFQRHLNKHWNN